MARLTGGRRAQYMYIRARVPALGMWVSMGYTINLPDARYTEANSAEQNTPTHPPQGLPADVSSLSSCQAPRFPAPLG